MQDHPMSHKANSVRSCLCPLILGLLAVSPAFADEPSVMVLEGDVSALYVSGDFTVFDPELERSQAKTAVAFTLSTPGDAPPSGELPPSAIGQAPIGPDGTFRLEIAVDKPRTAYFSIFNAITSDGFRMGPVRIGNNFILEPGELKFRMLPGSYFDIEGGYYNDAVYNSWRLSDEYQAAQLEFVRLITHEEDEPEQARRRRVDRLGAAQERKIQLEKQGKSKVASTHPDLLVRRLTIESAGAWFYGPWQLEALRGLAELMPEDPWVIGRIADMEASLKKAEENRPLEVGESVLSFRGETLNGEIVQMADLRDESRYLLVEFWASWCGPCRMEIPHMKQAYARFRDKGLEIVSFTVDDEREDWEEASAEEDLPWPNIGMGFETEAARAYKVRTSGVPKNYLVDSRTGKIVATDLRQHKLDEKLEELLP